MGDIVSKCFAKNMPIVFTHFDTISVVTNLYQYYVNYPKVGIWNLLQNNIMNPGKIFDLNW